MQGANVNSYTEKLPLTGIILAGGQSRRLHGIKKSLSYLGDQTIIERILNVLQTICAEIILSSNEPLLYQHLQVKIVKDLLPGNGAFGGLYSALHKAKYPYAFVVAGDMPFINIEAISCLWKQKEDFQVIIPQSPDGRQPLHAIYHRSCLPPIKEQLRRGNLKISSFFPQVKVRLLKTSDFIPLANPRLFFNINTPADLEHARRLFNHDSHYSGIKRFRPNSG